MCLPFGRDNDNTFECYLRKVDNNLAAKVFCQFGEPVYVFVHAWGPRVTLLTFFCWKNTQQKIGEKDFQTVNFH